MSKRATNATLLRFPVTLELVPVRWIGSDPKPTGEVKVEGGALGGTASLSPATGLAKAFFRSPLQCTKRHKSPYICQGWVVVPEHVLNAEVASFDPGTFPVNMYWQRL